MPIEQSSKQEILHPTSYHALGSDYLKLNNLVTALKDEVALLHNELRETNNKPLICRKHVLMSEIYEGINKKIAQFNSLQKSEDEDEQLKQLFKLSNRLLMQIVIALCPDDDYSTLINNLKTLGTHRGYKGALVNASHFTLVYGTTFSVGLMNFAAGVASGIGMNYVLDTLEKYSGITNTKSVLIIADLFNQLTSMNNKYLNEMNKLDLTWHATCLRELYNEFCNEHPEMKESFILKSVENYNLRQKAIVQNSVAGLRK